MDVKYGGLEVASVLLGMPLRRAMFRPAGGFMVQYEHECTSFERLACDFMRVLSLTKNVTVIRV